MSGIRDRLGTADRDARRDRGWSQAALADSAGVSQPLVSIIESGGVGASIESLGNVAEALDAELVIELRALIGTAGASPPSSAGLMVIRPTHGFGIAEHDIAVETAFRRRDERELPRFDEWIQWP